MTIWEELSRNDWHIIKDHSNSSVMDYEIYTKIQEERKKYLPTVLNALTNLNRRVMELEDKIKELEETVKK